MRSAPLAVLLALSCGLAARLYTPGSEAYVHRIYGFADCGLRVLGTPGARPILPGVKNSRHEACKALAAHGRLWRQGPRYPTPSAHSVKLIHDKSTNTLLHRQSYAFNIEVGIWWLRPATAFWLAAAEAPHYAVATVVRSFMQIMWIALRYLGMVKARGRHRGYWRQNRLDCPGSACSICQSSQCQQLPRFLWNATWGLP